ncbi:hypothetical protein EB24_00027, partial [Enterococcus hirae]
KTYVYYLDMIFKQATKVPFKIKQSSNVTELIVNYDALDYEFRDYSKSDVVRICKSRNFTNNSQLDNLIKELAKKVKSIILCKILYNVLPVSH